MSTKYKKGSEVPMYVIANRLEELSSIITKGKDSIEKAFVMRVPAEVDYCPDLVLAEAARRLRKLEKKK